MADGPVPEEPADARTGVAPAAAAAVGLAGGLASGLLGIGGGLVMVPLLTLLFAVPIKRAVGTSLLAILGIAAVAVATELVVAPGNVSWRAAAALGAGAIAGAVVGARMVAAVSPKLLGRLFAAVLLVAAARMAGLGALLARGETGGGEPPALPGPVLLAGWLLAGWLAGLLAAMFGIGGGIVAVPALAALHPDWSFQACRATSLAMIVVSSLAGALLHRRLRHVDAGLAAGLVPGGVAGGIGGVVLANSLPGRPLELAFAGLLVFAAWRLAVRRDEPAVR